MKQKVGELKGKPIIVADNPEIVSVNEILLEEKESGIVLKQRDVNGILIPITGKEEKTKESVELVDVIIDKESTIKGPNKWIKGTNYLFYINKADKFIIVDAATGKTKEGIANLVATGATNKVYSIPNGNFAAIEIKEI